MNKYLEKLFSPMTINKLEISNRIVMAPMTRSKSPKGIPNDDVASYYQKRAKNDVGLIITEGTTVDTPNASDDVNIPTFHGKEALEGWGNVVNKVHSVGGLIFPQIWHQGTLRRADTTWNSDFPSWGPSGLALANKKVSEPMTVDEIEKTIDSFVKAIYSSKELGFDGAEIHGAHGYLLDQFFWHGTNIRDDDWGGISLNERTQFSTEIVKRARKAVGDDFPIIFRFSQWKQQDFSHKMASTSEELGLFLNNLSNAGVDCFHCSQRRFWNNEFDGSDLNLAGWTKKLTKKPSITVGSVGLTEDFIETFKGKESKPTDISNLLERLFLDEYDFVAIGRALISNPDWVSLVKNEEYDKIKIFTPKDLEVLI
jgi:2,4-dienoyl-CoA reductase-like NADH-dependent reductase (Old Yellow Enzyme family)